MLKTVNNQTSGISRFPVTATVVSSRNSSPDTRRAEAASTYARDITVREIQGIWKKCTDRGMPTLISSVTDAVADKVKACNPVRWVRSIPSSIWTASI